MADLSGLSDDELMQMLQSHPDVVTPDPPAVNTIADPVATMRASPLSTGALMAGPLQSILRGATAGLSDKAEAAIAAGSKKLTGDDGSFGDLYRNALGTIRNTGDEYANAAPMNAHAGFAIGAVPSTLALGPEKAAATMGGRVLQAAGLGAGIGAAQGFAGTNDDSLKQDALATAQGAGIGAIAGTAAQPIAEMGVKPMVDYVARRFGPDAAKDQAVQQIIKRIGTSVQSGGPGAQDMLDLTSAANAAGKPAALVDYGGENVQGLAERIANTPGPGRQVLSQFLNARDKDAGSRVLGDINNVFPQGTAFDTANALDAARKTAAAPLYDAAFKANPSIQSPVIDKILETPAGKSALASARVKMQNDQSLMGLPDSEIREQMMESGQPIPKGGVASGLRLRTLDYVKRSLDDQIGAAQNAGERDNARILTGLKSQFVGALDNADVTASAGPNSLKPEGGLYAQARAAYSGPSQSMDALQRGTELFGKSPAEIKSEFGDLNPNDQEFYRLGAADAIKKKVMQTGPGSDEAKKLTGTQWAQDQVRPLFQDDASFNKFMGGLGAENQMFGTRAAILGNSRTALRQAEQDANEPKVLPPMMNFPGLAAHVGSKLLKSMSGPSPEVDAHIARILTTPGIANNPDLATQLLQAPTNPRISRGVVPLSRLAGAVYPELTTSSVGSP